MSALVEEVNQRSKSDGNKDAHHHRPSKNLLMTSPVTAAHSGQQVIAHLLLVFLFPKHIKELRSPDPVKIGHSALCFHD